MMPWIKRLAIFLSVTLTLLISGCATTVRSNVLAFNSWPTELKDNTYVFAFPTSPDSIEYRATENLVRQQLHRIGLQDASGGAEAKLVVALDYVLDARDLRVIAPAIADPYWMGPSWYGPYRRGRGWPYGPYGPYGGPYGPYGGPLAYDDITTHLFHRQLHLTITPVGGGKKLYEVMVENTSEIEDPNKILPVLVNNAFDGFPGQNGVVRTIDVDIKE